MTPASTISCTIEWSRVTWKICPAGRDTRGCRPRARPRSPPACMSIATTVEPGRSAALPPIVERRARSHAAMSLRETARSRTDLRGAMSSRGAAAGTISTIVASAAVDASRPPTCPPSRRTRPRGTPKRGLAVTARVLVDLLCPGRGPGSVRSATSTAGSGSESRRVILVSGLETDVELDRPEAERRGRRGRRSRICARCAPLDDTCRCSTARREPRAWPPRT